MKSARPRHTEPLSPAAPASACLELLEPRLLLSTTLIETGDAVRYVVPADDSLGTAWRAESFDDSAWTVGTTGVGYERSSGYEPYIATDVESEMYGVNETIYLRMEFDVPDPAAVEGLTLRMRYDDGFAAYINGVEVAAANAPETLTWNSGATGLHSDSAAVVFADFHITATGMLEAGTNVLAIQGLNYSPTSSDFLIVPELESGPVPEPWHSEALVWNESPVDLSFLNHETAGQHGFLTRQGDDLVFQDGTPARFWGANIAAYAIYEPYDMIAEQAERIAQLGYNLIRIHHHDSMTWVDRTVIDKTRNDSRHLDPEVMDRLDYWIYQLRENGVYVWLDLHVGRQFKTGDGITIGWDEIQNQGNAKGFDYFNSQLEALMQEFNEDYLTHVNSYTGLAYKDDPSIVGLLLTNEDDLTANGANRMLPDKNNPVHHGLMSAAASDFAAETGLSYSSLMRTWEPGPSKIFLNDAEHAWNERMIDHLHSIGVQAPIATTDYWQGTGAFNLPALTAGDVIDVHSYGSDGALGTNPRSASNYVLKVGGAQVHDYPLSVTEWNVPYDNADRFTAPIYMASIAALQGWDMMMLYNYSQSNFGRPGSPHTWSSFYDPALTGVMPAAALLYRTGQVSPALNEYLLQLDDSQLYYQQVNASHSATIRTLVEQSKLSIGLTDSPHLDWDSASTPAPDVIVVTDPDADHIPPGQTYVESDTGELRRDWSTGILTIDAARAQGATGNLGGQVIQLGDVTIELDNTEATVMLSALDGNPLAASDEMLLTGMAAVDTTGGSYPFRTEPLHGTVRIASDRAGMEVVPLDSNGTELTPLALTRTGGAFTLSLPTVEGTHWFLLRATGGPAGDFDESGTVDAADIDLLLAEIVAGTHDPAFDLTGDDLVNGDDADELVHVILGTEYGDATLDQAIDAADLSLLAANWQASGRGWATGDFTGGGDVDAADLSLLAANWMWDPFEMLATFDTDTEGFTYADDTFGTDNPDAADGAYTPTGGYVGGGLEVTLGPGYAFGALSGGWSTDFELSSAGTMSVSLRHRMQMSSESEVNEYVAALLAVDGVQYGTGGEDVLGRLYGDGPGGADGDTGWVQSVLEIPLAAGPHTLTIGAYLNRASADDEWAKAFFDDVSVAEGPAGASAPPAPDSGELIALDSALTELEPLTAPELTTVG